MTQLVTVLEGFTDSRLQWMFPPKSVLLEQGHLILDTLGGTGTMICWLLSGLYTKPAMTSCCVLAVGAYSTSSMLM